MQAAAPPDKNFCCILHAGIITDIWRVESQLKAQGRVQKKVIPRIFLWEGKNPNKQNTKPKQNKTRQSKTKNPNKTTIPKRTTTTTTATKPKKIPKSPTHQQILEIEVP